MIVSEWMGYALHYEAMLESVMYAASRMLHLASRMLHLACCILHVACCMLAVRSHARDKWLKPGGAVLPDVARVYIAAAAPAAAGYGFWDVVYGFDMRAVAREIRDENSKSALVRPSPRRGSRARHTQSAPSHRLPHTCTLLARLASPSARAPSTPVALTPPLLLSR